MNVKSIIGLIISVAALTVALWLEHVSYKSLFVPAALLIIFGGTFGATIFSFPASQIATLPKVLRKALSQQEYDAPAIIDIIVGFAQKARREGLLALEQEIKELDNEFLRKGIELVVDGNDPELVRDIMETQLSFLEYRHKIGQSIFESMGGYAPTMGMIGAIAGLIGVLSTLKDPTKLGPKVALAFVASFFGIAIANIVFLPLASRLKLLSSEEVLLGQLMIEGILSVQAGDNPRIVEEKLKAFLSPKERVSLQTGQKESEEVGGF